MKRALLLFRPRLALLNGIAAAGGYLLAPVGPPFLKGGAVLCGVMLLAAGSSALNQVMERDLDRLMERTKLRPLPRREMAPGTAVALGIFCLVGGMVLLGMFGGIIPVFLGGAGVAWYLGVYTPLKRRTPWALLLGGLCGAIPPLVGWSAAGHSPGDYRGILLAGLLYLWQIPHFWQVQCRHAEDYRRAGIPLLFPPGSGLHLYRVWIIALLAAGMMLPALGVIASPASYPFAAMLLVIGAVSFSSSERLRSTGLNFFPLVITLVIIL